MTAALLTEQELEIMKVIWEKEIVTVRDVYETLREQRQIAYTTVLTMMRILEQKGHLIKDSTERAHRFRPARPKKQVLGQMVRDFVGRVFNGSARPLLLQLVEDDSLTREDVQSIEKYLSEKKKK